MRRRDFVAAIAGAAFGPLAARAQQGEPAQHIGVLSRLGEGDPVQQSFMAALLPNRLSLGKRRHRAYSRLGCRACRPPSGCSLRRATPALAALRRATRSIPIVFIQVGDLDRRRLRCQPGVARRQYQGRMIDRCRSPCSVCW